MAKNLVIVESPTKAKTIEKYLGADYKVLASVGHVRDLPRSDFAIETDGDVHLRYEVPKGSQKVVTQIRKEAKDAERVFLATDLDREGEAIAWHVAEVAGIDTEPTTGSCSPRSPRTRSCGRSSSPGASTARSSTPSRPAARWTGSSATGCRRPCGATSPAASPPAASSRWPCGSSSTARTRSARFVPEEYWSLHGRFAREGKDFEATLHTVDGRRVIEPKKFAEHVEKGTADRYLVVRDESTAQALEQRTRAGADLDGRRRHPPGDQAQPGAAVHHLDPPAGGGAQARVQRQPHDARRPAAVRGHRRR
jgi:DNA topoisomerase I